VAFDPTTGTATLSWSAYQGQQPFAAYWVLRHVAESTVEDTFKLTDSSLTSRVDTELAPNTAYLYRVGVVNTSGFAVFSEEKSIPGYPVGPVVLLVAQADAQAGMARLRWGRFEGGAFRGLPGGAADRRRGRVCGYCPAGGPERHGVYG
jgi:hypothetical protein